MELVGEEEIKEVLDVLQSGYLYRYQVGEDPRFQGKVVKLEQEMARRSQVRHALAVNSGTTALLVALVGLGVGPGDEVVVPGFTFVASISSIVYAGRCQYWARWIAR
jgi:8-amino-3,8-dideoxy-alpha-D-manno-octulosonate transaminase